jgi:Uma2 family endonuclease
MAMPPDLASIAMVHKITRTEFNAMVEAGIFADEKSRDQLELIDGMLVVKPGPSPEHSRAVRRLLKILGNGLAQRDDVEISVQDAFAAGELYQPIPDLYVLPRWDDPTDHPDRAFLVVEVSRSRLRFDRTIKHALYARVGIPEYWIVNVIDHVIEVHRDPRPDGYASLTRAVPGDVIQSLAFPAISVDVADVLGVEVSR